jgi:hypothetical protein
MQLLIKHSHEYIPVSRSNMAQIKEAIKSVQKKLILFYLLQDILGSIYGLAVVVVANGSTNTSTNENGQRKP